VLSIKVHRKEWFLMNPVQGVLDQELASLLERLASSVPLGSLSTVATANPSLKARLDTAEAQLGAARASMLEGYGRWGRALEDIENLWAVAALREEGPGPSAPQAPALAA
jgi:hypothetical protein